MSRGLGELQRKILRCLEPDRILSIRELASKTHGPRITRSEYECIRRALKSLERQQIVGKVFWSDENIDLWTTDAKFDDFFEKFCENQAKYWEAKNATLNQPDKSCIADQSNTYPVEVVS